MRHMALRFQTMVGCTLLSHPHGGGLHARALIVFGSDPSLSVTLEQISVAVIHWICFWSAGGCD